MEFLVALAPIALILLLCGGMHFFMMRGMHGGHEAGADHEGHSSSEGSDRVNQLESQVRRLQEELETRQAGTPGRSGDLTDAPPVAVGRRSNGSHGSHAGGGCH